MKVAIIGGSGFIGSRLARRLSRSGVPFVIVDKEQSQEFKTNHIFADVRNAEEIRAAVPNDSIIIHLAAEHRDNVLPRELYDEVNVSGAINICSTARCKNIKTIVFTSSVAVYGFARPGTDESGAIRPFNDYGRTKHEAEMIFRQWQRESREERSLVIIRPTVVFGEQNRGNVYNLMRQVFMKRFVMIGPGTNRKSLAYVENVSAFLEHAMNFEPGLHTYNYVDKPDFDMNELIFKMNCLLGRLPKTKFRLPFKLAYVIAKFIDLLALATGKRFAISALRVKKFTSDSTYQTAVDKTGFVPPVSLAVALERTIRHEFLSDRHNGSESKTSTRRKN